ncbi:MAG: aminoglycoside phosphotransferase family protein [Actinomycetia bacterium]|nr:aminoglycoside phosphotransferase family protein [Actinomycetes bacterium]
MTGMAEVAPAPADIAAAFALPGPVADAPPYGGGHVNRTYRVTCAGGERFVLQRINRRAFAVPEHVMENIVTVTRHLASRTTDPRASLRLVPTHDGSWWHTDAAGEVWRCYAFIEGSTELSSPLTPDKFRLVGHAFGRFLVDLDDLPVEGLHTTIPHYHDEPRYLARLRAAIAADPCGRVAEVGPEIARALSYEAASHDFDEPGLMPIRATHNDAKVSNLLVDATTGEALAVVDLDTVQPGYAVCDFGDAIRSGATTAPEDEPDPAKVRFVPDLFEAFAEGYLGACGDVLQPSEIAHLRHGARIMTLETTLRFLLDYLEGDVYYAIDHPTQNLDRARNQGALLDDLNAHWDDMGRIIDRLVA